MRALTVVPGVADSAAITERPAPAEADGPVLVEVLDVGLCGTDREILAGEYGTAPPGAERLVLGHESLGRVQSAPLGCGLTAGDLVVAFVRRPDPVPCQPCAADQWDMCRNGRYTEHGIKGLDGFAREHYRTSPDTLVRLDPGLEQVGVLLEPTSVVAKAWDQITHIGSRVAFTPRTALITGAGPIGLLAALLGVQRGLDVHVLDRVTDGPKPDLVTDLGATYHHTNIDELGLVPDIVVECTGAPSVVGSAMSVAGPDGITCLTGVSTGGRRLDVDIGGLNRDLVLSNAVVVGSVNAGRAHYEAAGRALAEADHGWLRRLITRRVRLVDFADALARHDEDVKVVLEVGA